MKIDCKFCGYCGETQLTIATTNKAGMAVCPHCGRSKDGNPTAMSLQLTARSLTRSRLTDLRSADELSPCWQKRCDDALNECFSRLIFWTSYHGGRDFVRKLDAYHRMSKEQKDRFNRLTRGR